MSLPPAPLPAELQLPATLLARYLFFLQRRPISRSNHHFLARRLAGLRSLAPLLAGHGDPDLDAAAAEVATLAPGSLGHLGAALQARLAPRLARELPPDVVVTPAPPPRGYLDPVRRVLLVLGPAIGVGDEILAFGVARALRRRLPEAEITTLSAYPGLWDAVAAVDRRLTYRHHAELVPALGGRARDGGRDGGGVGGGGGAAAREAGSDLLVMVDFEKPALTPAVALDGGIARYVEISPGARSVTAWDAAERWLHRDEAPEPYQRNHYAALARFLAWLAGPEAGAAALPPAPPSRAQRAAERAPERAPEPAPERAPERATERAGRHGATPARTTLLVSPFTSKHEPSLVYWSRLLAAAVPPQAAGRTRLLVDPGPNSTTEGFAAALAQATRAAAAPGLETGLASHDGERRLSLAGALAAIAAADAVVCSDSFAAHAAPALGRPALVVAQPGLEDWRVPAPGSFYFADTVPLPRLAEALRRALTAAGVFDEPESGDGTGSRDGGGTGAGSGHDSLPRPWMPAGSAGLVAGTRRCSAALAAGRGERARDEYEALGRRLRVLLAEPTVAADPLFADRPAADLLPPIPGSRRGEPGADLLRHLADRLETWRNSNLCKYLELVAGAGAVQAEQAEQAEQAGSVSEQAVSEQGVGPEEAGARDQVSAREQAGARGKAGAKDQAAGREQATGREQAAGSEKNGGSAAAPPAADRSAPGATLLPRSVRGGQ